MEADKLEVMFSTLWPNGIPPKRYGVAAALATLTVGSEIADAIPTWVDVEPKEPSAVPSPLREPSAVRAPRNALSARTAGPKGYGKVAESKVSRLREALRRGPVVRDQAIKEFGSNRTSFYGMISTIRAEGLRVKCAKDSEGRSIYVLEE